MKVGITGANGFLGSNLSKFLKKKNFKVRDIQRKYQINTFQLNAINSCTNWDKALEDIDILIHCAGNAHKINLPKNKEIINTLDLLNTNLLGTINLTKSCIKNGVKKIIFISSIKVLGENNNLNNPFSNITPTNPNDIYSWSKLEAENSIKALCENSDTNFTIIRPPLIFGPGVKANFSRLIKLIKLQIPMPFGSIKNKRSFIYVDNLSSFIHKCITYNASDNQTFVISDYINLSTNELINLIAKYMNIKVFIFKFPLKLLKLFFIIIGKKNDFNKLTSSLIINPESSFKIMDWKPDFDFDLAIKKTLVIDS